MSQQQHQIIIVGGGLAGLISSILLKRKGLKVLLIEKNSYPFNRVCGEYISNEVKPFLEAENLFPHHLFPSSLKKFVLSDIKGNQASINLPLGGFGISRYQFDQYLYQQALLDGVETLVSTEVTDIAFKNSYFEVKVKDGRSFQSDFVIGAYGKRSKLDKKLKRKFIEKRSPFIGVKYHAYVDYPSDQIGLYNFPGGYCGVSQVEGGHVNICYLSKKSNLKAFGDIQEMEKEVLYKNPTLKSLFSSAQWLREKPEVINEISFEKKPSVENHILMAGDTAGLITPLCGNGMAMAIHAGKIASECVYKYYSSESVSRKEVEKTYQREWKRHFSKRLWVGRKTQNLFGNQSRSNLAVRLIHQFPSIGRKIVEQTHGDKIE